MSINVDENSYAIIVPVEGSGLFARSLALAAEAKAAGLSGFPSRAEFISADLSSVTDGQIVWASGQPYRKQAGATTLVDKPGFVPAWPYHIDQWGVTRGETGDNAARLQAAHDYVASIGGGEVDLGEGVIPFASTLYFGEGPGVLFVGHGKGWITNGKQTTRDTAVTRLRFTGTTDTAGIVYTSNRNNDGTLKKRGGGGIIHTMIDGGELGGVGVDILSHAHHEMDIHTCYWRSGHFRVSCLSNSVTEAPGDVQRVRWRIATSDVNSGNQAPWHVVLNGIGAANTSISEIDLLDITAESTSVAVHFGDCDALHVRTLFAGTRAAASGDGGKVFFHATDTLPASAGASVNSARYVTVGMCQAGDGIVAKKAITGTGHSGPNHILSISRGNAAPAPVCENGALLWWGDDAGEFHARLGVIRTFDDTNAITPGFFLRKDSTAGFAGQGLAKIQWRGTNSAGSQNIDMGRFDSIIMNATPGAETNRFGFWPNISGNGEALPALLIQNGIMVPDGVVDVFPRGFGTVNASASYWCADLKVIGPRVTGLAAATGTADRTAFSTSTVTTEQLAQRLKALIDDLRTHGLIGN